jgi:hypothetical protein
MLSKVNALRFRKVSVFNCPNCPVRIVLSRLSCPNCHVPAVPVIYFLSYFDRLLLLASPGCSFLFSCLPVLSLLSYSDHPVLYILFRRSCPRCPVLKVLSPPSRSCCLVLAGCPSMAFSSVS